MTARKAKFFTAKPDTSVLTALKNTLIRRHSLGVAALMLAIFISAISVVYIKSMHRNAFIALTTAQKQHEQLQTEWHQLLLEESTWSSQDHVAQVAKKFGFHPPTASQIRLIIQPKIGS